MDKIDNVDLREALEAIARTNTHSHLHNDLDISIEQMERAAKLSDLTDKTLIWVSYPSGIDCYPERDVFQKGTRGYNGVLHHGSDKQSEFIAAYAVDVSGIKDGRVYGSLFETDIREYAEFVKNNAVVSSHVRIYVDDPHGRGKQEVMPTDEFNRRYPLDLVKMAYWRHEPDEPSDLQAVTDYLWKIIREENYKPRNIWLHTSDLYEKCYRFYAKQLMADLSLLEKPNSRDGQNFTVPFDSMSAVSFDPERLTRLLDKLPYDNAAFTIQKGQHGVNLTVPRDEVMLNRAEKAGKSAVIPEGKAKTAEKPSVLAALEANSQRCNSQFGGVTGPGKDTIKKNFGEEH